MRYAICDMKLWSIRVVSAKLRVLQYGLCFVDTLYPFCAVIYKNFWILANSTRSTIIIHQRIGKNYRQGRRHACISPSISPPTCHVAFRSNHDGYRTIRYDTIYFRLARWTMDHEFMKVPIGSFRLQIGHKNGVDVYRTFA